MRKFSSYRNRENMKRHLIVAAVLLPITLWHGLSYADIEVRKIQIEIRNSGDTPMRGVRLKCRGHSEISELSSDSGLTYLPLPPGLAPGDPITIELELEQGLAREWVILQPYQGSFNVPGKSKRYSEIILIRREHLDAMLSTSRATRDENTQRNVSVSVSVNTFDGLGASSVNNTSI